MKIPSSLAPEYQQFLTMVPSKENAFKYCEKLATTHYENFTVVSWMLPKALRSHFYNIYAYCRWSDDLADEMGNTQDALESLQAWEYELEKCFAGHAEHPVFLALLSTIEKFDIPKTPFKNLLVAFKQDQSVQTYQTFDDLLGYCRNSANPVGHLVLYLCGYRDVERQQLSDYTCTALQLANFWQDVKVDLQKGRIYIPLEDIEKFHYSEELLRKRKSNDYFKKLMKFEVDRTLDWFHQGLPLCKLLKRDVRLDIELFNRGGMAILEQIRRMDYDVLNQRPSLSKGQKGRLMLRRILGF